MIHVTKLNVIVLQNYGFSLIHGRIFPIFFNFAVKIIKGMKYKVVQFNISVASADQLPIMRDLVDAAAGEAGFEAFEDTDDGCKGYIQDRLFDKELLAEKLKEAEIEGCSVSFTVDDVADENWNATWEQIGFAPIEIGDQMIIYDKAHTTDEDLQQMTTPIKIGIEAHNAFGTGTHETTRIILKALIELSPEGKRVLDCGCGTGILSIAASKLGAREVVAYDIDEWSVKNTKHNAEINGVDNIEVYEGDAHILSHINGMFDVVLANINRNILLQDMESFDKVLSIGGNLIISGFFEADIQPLITKASVLGLTEVKRYSDGEWRAIVLVHNK